MRLGLDFFFSSRDDMTSVMVEDARVSKFAGSCARVWSRLLRAERTLMVYDCNQRFRLCDT